MFGLNIYAPKGYTILRCTPYILKQDSGVYDTLEIDDTISEDRFRVNLLTKDAQKRNIHVTLLLADDSKGPVIWSQNIKLPELQVSDVHIPADLGSI